MTPPASKATAGRRRRVAELALVVGAGSLACSPVDEPATPAPGPPLAETQAVRFVEVGAESGVAFTHENGPTPDKHFPEPFGGGALFWDFDRDGRLDIYLVNSGWLLDADRQQAVVNSLYRNEGEGRFVAAGARAGVDHDGYGMGCAAGDADNDGDLDLYVTNYGPNVFYRNDGDGSFTDFTASAGVGDSRWGSSHAFADYDLDGDLDLYVANYVDYDPVRDVGSGVPYLPTLDLSKFDGDIKAYSIPSAFDGVADILYRNDGQLRFTDVTREAGLYDEGGRGLGVVFADCDGDGWPDLYVANDLVRNFLYHNNGDGTFSEVAGRAGTAFGRHGQVEAGMGTDFGDYDNDGRLDLTVTNFQKEPNTLYHNRGDGYFSDESFASATGLITLPLVGFGTHFFDYDNDGRQDLFVANGHVLNNIKELDASTTYAQRNLLLRNRGPNQYGNVTFADVSAGAGIVGTDRVSRASAVGDYDDDGDLDLLVTNLGGPAELWRNDGGNRHHWLSVTAVGTRGNRDGIGAKVSLWCGDLFQMKEVRGSRGYQSQSDLRLHFGLGEQARVDSLEVAWPGGGRERFADLPGDRFITVTEAQGLTASRAVH